MEESSTGKTGRQMSIISSCEGLTGARAGVVYIVGAGPGDPALLTTKAAALANGCDAIVYDALVNSAILEKPRACGTELYMVGRRGGSAPAMRQDGINALLVDLARQGKSVVRLKGGDPFMFGRGAEEAVALTSAGVPVEVVPGISAGSAAPAYAGIPVTHTGIASLVTFAAGQYDATDRAQVEKWSAVARAGGTIVLYMAGRTLSAIAETLMAAGMSPSTPAAAIQWATHPRQRTIVDTVATLAQAIVKAGLTEPLIIVIGPVAALRESMDWFERRPLQGWRLLVERHSPWSRASGWVSELTALGMDLTVMPAVQFEPVNSDRLATEIDSLDRYEWLVFATPATVRQVWDRLLAQGRDVRYLARVRISATDQVTASALSSFGIVPDTLLSEPASTLPSGADLPGASSRVLCLGSANDTSHLNNLAAGGASVTFVPVMRESYDERETRRLRQRLDAGEIHGVVLSSASMVRALINAIGEDAARALPALSTDAGASATLRGIGGNVVAEIQPGDVAALRQVLSSWNGTRPPLRTARRGKDAAHLMGAAPKTQVPRRPRTSHFLKPFSQ